MRTTISETDPQLPMHSQKLLGWFGAYGRHYVQRKFNAIRLLKNPLLESGSQIPELTADEPVIFYLNHPSWWDPMILITLATGHYATRHHFAPMDEAMLRQYAFFKRLGFFGIKPDSAKGAVTLLRTAANILSQNNTTLWITAQGQFVDVRQRPLALKPGLAHIAKQMTRGKIIPIAIEYTFWNQSTPEALLAIGQPIEVTPLTQTHEAHQWQERLTSNLSSLMDDLAAAAGQRDEALFDLLNPGRRGVGGIYDLWRRLKSWKQGQRFDPTHPPTSHRISSSHTHSNHTLKGMQP